MAARATSPARSLYIHVPFCARKCEYCAFYSTSADGELVNRYVRGLIRELETRRDELATRPETLFFGGGTPSLLNLRQWEAVLRALERLDLLGAAEWTVECNPATVSADKAALLRAHGVNRISMGVQSLDEDLLDRLGRVHSRDMVFRSFDTLRAAGFENINLDLMFAIPGQSLATWRATLREAMAMGSEHLSSYEVIYEEDTPLYAQLQAGEIDVDEGLASDMFEALVDAAGENGFAQYEVANFARAGAGPCRSDAQEAPAVPALACRHNVNYWRGGAYAAFGPSAAGFEAGVRYRNVGNTVGYCERLERGELPREMREELPPLARAGEIAAFGLRMNRGWEWGEFREATGFDLREEWSSEMDALVKKGWGIRSAKGFRLSALGLRFADAAGSEFLRLASD
jgi:oxygen-independent coproporphyrinogen-3 oxidase